MTPLANHLRTTETIDREASVLKQAEEALEACRSYLTQYGTSQSVRALDAQVNAALNAIRENNP